MASLWRLRICSSSTSHGAFLDPKMPSSRDERPRFHWLSSPFPWDLSKGGSSQTSELLMYRAEFPPCQPIWEMLRQVTS